MFLTNIDNPVKVRNQLKRMYKQNPQFCYSWDFDTREVYGLDKNDYVASLYEVQLSGLVKRCECWAKQRFIVQRQPQVQNNRKSSIDSNEKPSKSPKISANNASINNCSYNSNTHPQHDQHCHGNCVNHVNSQIVPQHDKYVIRFESYGHSKRERMTQSINPLSYAFDKVLVDYVYLFIETEEVSKQKLIKEINKSIKNARYYDATRKFSMLEEVFNEKNTVLSQRLINIIEKKKKEQENLNHILTQHLPISLQKIPSQTGRSLLSGSSQSKKQKQNRTQNVQSDKHVLKEATTDNKLNSKNPQENLKEKGRSHNVQNSQQLDQNTSDHDSNKQQLNQQQKKQPPPNSVASQTRHRSPMISASTSNLNQSPITPLQLANNSLQKPHSHGSPKKVSAFNASPSKSTIATICSDNSQTQSMTTQSPMSTRSGVSSPKKISNQSPKKISSQSPKKLSIQSPQKIIQQSSNVTASPNLKSSNISSQNYQQQQQLNKNPSNEIKTRSHDLQKHDTKNNLNDKELTPDLAKQKRKSSNDSDKEIQTSQLDSTIINSPMQTRHQEQQLNNHLLQQQLNNQELSLSNKKKSTKSSEISDHQNNNQSEMEIEETNTKLVSKGKQSPKIKAFK